MKREKIVDKVGDVRKFSVSKEGHALTYIKGHRLPILGAPFSKLVKAMDPTKAMLKFFIGRVHKLYRKAYQDPDSFVPQVKEIHRVFTLIAERWRDPNMKELTLQVRDLACMGLENDVAYRDVLEYAATQVDLKKLKPRPEDLYWRARRKSFNFSDEKKDMRK